MKNIKILKNLVAAFFVVFIFILSQIGEAQAQGLKAVVDPVAINEAVPLKLTGFDSVTERLLDFYLEIVGFEVTDKSPKFELVSAKTGIGGILYRLSGGRVKIFGETYSGSNDRAKIQTLADRVVETIRKVKPIAKTKLVFRARTTGRGSSTSDIYICDIDGGNVRRLTNDKTINKDPVYNPKSGKAYYLSYMQSTARILSHSLSSGNRQNFAFFGGTSFAPSISADGSKVAAILSRDGNPELYVANSDGRNWKRLTKTKAPEFSPCWSPDGRTICYSSKRSGNPRLYTVNVSGGRSTELRTGGALLATEPDWSPDGKWIAFTRQTRGSFYVCVVPAEGGSHRPIVEGEDPSWSPNSRTLTFSRRLRNGSRVISMLDVPTKQVKDLNLRSLGSCSQPSWGK